MWLFWKLSNPLLLLCVTFCWDLIPIFNLFLLLFCFFLYHHSFNTFSGPPAILLDDFHIKGIVLCLKENILDRYGYCRQLLNDIQQQNRRFPYQFSITYFRNRFQINEANKMVLINEHLSTSALQFKSCY